MTEIPADIWEKAVDVENDNDGAGPTACVMNIARALHAERLSEREACATVAERDADWSAFGKRGIEQWAGGPDAVRDYRLGLSSGRAIAAAIRAR